MLSVVSEPISYTNCFSFLRFLLVIILCERQFNCKTQPGTQKTTRKLGKSILEYFVVVVVVVGGGGGDVCVATAECMTHILFAKI